MELNALSQDYSVRKLNPKDIEIIFELSKQNHTFYHYHPPLVTKSSILEDMNALPPGKDYNDKYYIGFFDQNKLIAVMDLILGFPTDSIAFIGLFMMDISMQGKGIGSKVISECISYLALLGYKRVRLGIDKGNPQSAAFWTKNHFAVIGIETQGDVSVLVTMERIL